MGNKRVVGALAGVAAGVCAVGGWGCASASSELTGAATSGAGGDGGGTGGSSNSDGGFMSPPGSGGSGGGEDVCSPGDTEACFSGPMEALGVGICAGGERTCIADGEFGVWGACEGEQLPLTEVCDTLIDEDCNGQTDEVCDNCIDGEIQSCGLASACDFQLCVAGAWSPCGAASPVVLDDSFEGATPGEGIPVPTVVSSWSVISGNVDVMQSPAGLTGPSHSGAKAVDLNGWNPGALRTTLTTVPGATYLMRFAYTKNPSPEVPMPTGAQVLVDGVSTLSLTAAQMNNYSNLMWECAVLKFTASAATTTLEVGSTTGIPQNGGVYVDSFLVTQP